MDRGESQESKNMTTTNELPKPTESVEEELARFRADEPKKLAELRGLRERGRQYAEELQQVAEAVGMPLSRGTSVIARVRELVILANAKTHPRLSGGGG
jgi:hypothetical protein